MREPLLWHLKKLSLFYGKVCTSKNNCGNSPDYWRLDKKDIDRLIRKLEKSGVKDYNERRKTL